MRQGPVVVRTALMLVLLPGQAFWPRSPAASSRRVLQVERPANCHHRSPWLSNTTALDSPQVGCAERPITPPREAF